MCTDRGHLCVEAWVLGLVPVLGGQRAVAAAAAVALPREHGVRLRHRLRRRIRPLEVVRQLLEVTVRLPEVISRFLEVSRRFLEVGVELRLEEAVEAVAGLVGEHLVLVEVSPGEVLHYGARPLLAARCWRLLQPLELRGPGEVTQNLARQLLVSPEPLVSLLLALAANSASVD